MQMRPGHQHQGSLCSGADHEDDPCDLGVVEEEAKIDVVSFCMRISVILNACLL